MSSKDFEFVVHDGQHDFEETRDQEDVEDVGVLQDQQQAFVETSEDNHDLGEHRSLWWSRWRRDRERDVRGGMRNGGWFAMESRGVVTEIQHFIDLFISFCDPSHP
jgi:hypothetical protein